MILQTSRIFSLLLVVSVATLPLFLSWSRVSKSISDKKEKPSAATTVQTEVADTTRKVTDSGAAAESIVPVLSKKSFDRLPQWDFGDVYSQDAPPRHTTCVQSLYNSEDEGFQRAFLPDIRLFLQGNCINTSEWKRLSHFNSPFGFMGYTYDDIMASVRLIPKPAEPLLPLKPAVGECVRCAVVGTAGILNGSKMGKEIDGHDYVFRMNGAVIKGHEDDVGSRTSVYVHTAHSITRTLSLLQHYGYTSVPTDEGIKYVMIPEGIRDFRWLEGLLTGGRVSAGVDHNIQPRIYYGGQFNESRFYVLHQDFLRYVRNRFLKSEMLNTAFWAIYRPTTGAFSLFLALHTCDIVSAYGFMTEDYEKYSNYYFERNKTSVVFYLNHDYILEKNMWTKLHNSGIIRLYQRTGLETET